MSSQKQSPKEIRQNGCCESLSIIFEKYLQVSILVKLQFLKINFFIDTTHSTFQRRINVLSTLWMAIEITWSDVENERKSEVGFSTLYNIDTTSVSNIKNSANQLCTTSMPLRFQRCTNSFQRWNVSTF